MGEDGDAALNENNSSSGNAPIPYSLEGQLVPHEGYYYPEYPRGQEPAGGSDWDRIAKLLWFRKWWILGTVILGTGLGWAGTGFIAPSYETFTTVWLQDVGSARGGGRAQSGAIRAGGLLQGEGWADVFRSRAVLRPVVEALGLQLRVVEPDDLDRSLFGEFLPGTEEVVPGAYTLKVRASGSWSLARGGAGTVQTGTVGQSIEDPAGFEWKPSPALWEMLAGEREIRFNVSTVRNTVFELAEGLEVQYNQNSSIIRAKLIWGDSNEGAFVLNALAAQFVTVATDLKATKIREEVDMLEEQTQYTLERLQGAEFALENHRIQTITEPSETVIGFAPSATPGTVGQPATMYAVFSQRKIQADQLSYDLGQIRDILRTVEEGAAPNLLAIRMIPSAASSPELSAATGQLQQARVDRQTFLYTYTEDYPVVVQKAQEIDDLEQRIIPGALVMLANQVESQLELLNQQIAAQGSELREIPSRTIEGARLQREVDHAATLNNSLQLRLKSAQLAEATSGPGIQVLDRAWPARSALGDKPARLIALASLAGLGLGIAGVLVLERLDNRIRYPDQITSSLGLPVLGVVPRLDAAPDPASPTAAIAVESFRGLRTQIAHVDGNVEGVTLVTSPAPREGKSMVSANLAISYATAGYKTLLLDGDTRRGRAQEMFDLKRTPGLTDYLMGRVTLEQAQQVTSVPNLTLIARGAPGGFNADLLESERMDGMLAALREQFEVILVDGPPLAAGADTLILGQRSDKVVVVLRAGTTKEDLARAKLATLGNVRLPIVGAVLNAMPKSAPYYDYYVHYYYADAEIAS